MREARELAKNEFGVNVHAVFFQHGEKFGIKAQFSVMRFLIADVANDHGNNGSAHAEGRVALLPCELVAFLVGPSRGIRFDGENRLGQCQDRWNLDEEMNVIFHSAHGMNKNSVFFANTCCVGPDARLKFLGDGFAAVFGAEDNMNYVLSVCVGHVPHLRCWKSLYITDPGPSACALG